MSEDYQTWVYHIKHDPKIVLFSEAKELYKNGCEDSPAKCIEKPVIKKIPRKNKAKK